MSDQLSLGWAEVDCTPDRKAELCGQYYQRVSTGLHSRLKAVAFAVEQGGEQAVFVSLDVVNFPESFQHELQRRAAAIPGLDSSKIVLNAIHTHSAPPVANFREWWKSDPEAITADEYAEFLLGRLVEVVKAAWDSRRPGSVARAFASARVGHCRRAVYADGAAEMYGDTGRDDFLGMEGGEDSGVELLFTYGADGEPTGVVVNVACPSQVMEATHKISSDFMGRLRELLKQRFGDGFNTLCQVSAAGCQSPRDLTRNYRGEPDFWHEDGVEAMALRLFEAVDKTSPQPRAQPVLKHVIKRLELPRRRVSYPEWQAAAKEIARLEAIQGSEAAYRDFCRDVRANEGAGPGPYDSKLHHFVLIENQKAVLRRYEDQTAAPTVGMDLHVVRFGDAVFASNPFELYLDFGAQMKARSPAAQTFLVQLSCGSLGYLPSARAEQLGGYGGLVINGQVGSDGGKMLVDATLATIKELFP